jgi:protein-L-isoaspartate(D-aspartate) O-methyltransferase
MASENGDQAFYASQRHVMVERQLAARGIRSPLVLQAMGKVPREAFVPPSFHQQAYEDAALPIAEQQTISQPYVVAYMLEALQLKGGERVLEIGAGSGYAAAVLSQIASDVITVERHQALADHARNVLKTIDYRNVRVIHADGALGWSDAAPYEAIIVAAGAGEVPGPLKKQLTVGGRLVIPIGDPDGQQSLVRITRTGKDEFEQERLMDVHFVPLVSNATPKAEKPKETQPSTLSANLHPRHRKEFAKPAKPVTSELLAEAAEPIDDLERSNIDSMLERIGDSKVVLIGEASHGTSEFYRFRARITRELIEKKGFNFVAVEADWPDARRIDQYVRHQQVPASDWTAFTRFPTWMWRNEEVRGFVDWLRNHNAGIAEPNDRVGFYGLDLYSMYTSIDAVLSYLEDVDPETAQLARERYGCLTPWKDDPATYGRAAISGRYRECEEDVIAMLADLLSKRLDYATADGVRFMDAIQNARLVTNAERYYRSMYAGYSESWNLRDQHMFDTLESLRAFAGSDAKAIIWEHNSHIGDASATDMVARGQHNVGQLCREAYGDDAYLIGFGTHTGTVAAATDWDDPMEIKQVRPSLTGSWERFFHETDIPAFTVGLREPASDALDRRLHEVQLERAIGVIYRPETERASHYFRARLADQFDEYVWFDETRAVTPLDTSKLSGQPDTYPFGV